MKHLKQFLIILLISFIGELLKIFIPLPIPASIYGMVIMLLLLGFKILKPEHIKDTAIFLLEIMPVMFIPAAVGLIDSWGILKPIILSITIITIISTILVMGISAKATEFIIKKGKDN